jgi:hypothetical protein
MTTKLCKLPARAARRLRAGVIGVLGLSGLMAMPLPALATMPIPGSPGALMLTPSDIRDHYKLPTQNIGKFQTVVLVTGYLPDTYKTTTAHAAFNAYSRYFQLPQWCNTVEPSCLEVVDMQANSVGGTQDPVDIQTLEATTLDIELVHAIAPGTKIVVLSAPSGTDPAALNQKILDLKPTVVVLGKTRLEFPGQTSTQTNCLCDGFFAAHPEIVFLSGTGNYNVNGLNYPATSPYVTAVGRTQWAPFYNDGVELPREFAYGFSSQEAMPEFQKRYLAATGSPWLSQSNQRAIPDVAFQASILQVAFHSGTGSEIGSTSGIRAAPAQWAGIIALMGEEALRQGFSLGDLLRANDGFNNLLYRADVAKTFNHFGTDAFHSQAGLGRPDVTKLITAITTPLPLIGSITVGTTCARG